MRSFRRGHKTPPCRRYAPDRTLIDALRASTVLRSETCSGDIPFGHMFVSGRDRRSRCLSNGVRPFLRGVCQPAPSPLPSPPPSLSGAPASAGCPRGEHGVRVASPESSRGPRPSPSVRSTSWKTRHTRRRKRGRGRLPKLQASGRDSDVSCARTECHPSMFRSAETSKPGARLCNRMARRQALA